MRAQGPTMASWPPDFTAGGRPRSCRGRQGRGHGNHRPVAGRGPSSASRQEIPGIRAANWAGASPGAVPTGCARTPAPRCPRPPAAVPTGYARTPAPRCPRPPALPGRPHLCPLGKCSLCCCWSKGNSFYFPVFWAVLVVPPNLCLVSGSSGKVTSTSSGRCDPAFHAGNDPRGPWYWERRQI